MEQESEAPQIVQQQALSNKPLITEGVKIFFITLTTICTLIITASQSYLAYKQYQAAKLAYSPIFIFRKDFTKNASTKNYETESLKVFNMGYPINSYTAKEESYLKIIKKTYNSDRNELRFIPITYYAAQVTYSGGKDEMGNFIGTNDNNSDFANLFWGINKMNLARKTEDPSYEIELVQSMSISYSDIEGEEYTKYYLDFKPSAQETLEQLKQDSTGHVLPKELNNITIDQILKLFN